VRRANPKALSIVPLLTFRPTRCRPSRSLSTYTSVNPNICAMLSLLPPIVPTFCCLHAFSRQSPTWPRPILSAARTTRFVEAEFLLHPFSRESILIHAPPLFFASQYRSLVLYSSQVGIDLCSTSAHPSRNQGQFDWRSPTILPFDSW
jgi:hypothetical protein